MIRYWSPVIPCPGTGIPGRREVWRPCDLFSRFPVLKGAVFFVELEWETENFPVGEAMTKQPCERFVIRFSPYYKRIT